MLRVSVPAEYSYCLLDCSGIGKHSQGANINISLNLMNLLRNVTALTFNIHQIIENYMTPISHFDVHGTWAVCIWLISCFVTGLPLCKVILCSKPSLLIAAHLFLFHEYVSVPTLFPLTKLLQPRLPLLLCLLSSPDGNVATQLASWAPLPGHVDAVFLSFVSPGLIHSIGTTQLVPFPYCQC